MRATRWLFVCLLVLLGGPAAAGAATTYGTTTGEETFILPAGGAGVTLVEPSVGPLSAGVVTSWSVRIAAPGATAPSFKVLRPVPGTPGTYRVVGSGAGSIPTSRPAMVTSAARIATEPGDRIGLFTGGALIPVVSGGELSPTVT